VYSRTTPVFENIRNYAVSPLSSNKTRMIYGSSLYYGGAFIPVQWTQINVTVIVIQQGGAKKKSKSKPKPKRRGKNDSDSD